MTSQTVLPQTLYAVDLGFLAGQRGERLVCQVLGFSGRDEAYARVRIVRSLIPVHRYRAGREHRIHRTRLVPLDILGRAGGCPAEGRRGV